MKKDNSLRILWLGSVFDQATLLSARAVSPAANRWQIGFIQALQHEGASVQLVGYLPEPVWPRGRLRIQANDGHLPIGLHGHLMSYWNLPVWRNSSIGGGYRHLIRQVMETGPGFDVVMTYNGYPANVVGATYARKRYGIPWICIVADDDAPTDADGYMFLSWGYHETFGTSKPKLHLDGGVSEIRFSPKSTFIEPNCGRQIIMFTGSMAPFAGADYLAHSFHRVDNNQAELWLCGKGENESIRNLALADSRIKLMGLVPEEKLLELMQQADIFVNPRPSKLSENDKNFPSKLFEYLSYGKPIISTWTPGLSPEYCSVLIILEEETEECLATTISDTLLCHQTKKTEIANAIDTFISSRLWPTQAKRLIDWLAKGGFVSCTLLLTLWA